MSLLAGYYAAIEAEKHAGIGLTQAQAGLTWANAAEVARNAASQRDEEASRSRANDAGSQRQLQEAGQVAPNAASQRALQGAQTGLVQTQNTQLPIANTSEAALRAAQAGLYTPQGAVAGFSGLPEGYVPNIAGGGFGITPVAPDPNRPAQGDSKGGKIVPEKQVVQGKAAKPGPSDTVPAMLTPGEAVLNKGAVGHYGTDVIDHMNKMGLLRMGAQSEMAKHLGLPDPHAAPAKAKDKDAKAPAPKAKGKAAKAPQGFARGTSMVLPAMTPATPPSRYGLTTATR